jgi:hypothetical protein
MKRISTFSYCLTEVSEDVIGIAPAKVSGFRRASCMEQKNGARCVMHIISKTQR